MKRFDARITSLTAVSDDYYELRFAWPTGLPRPEPGAFMTVRAGGEYDPILRRPFAFSDFRDAAPDSSAGGGAAGDAEAAFIFERRGRGTAYLAGLRAGDSIDVLAPLGKGFTPPPRGSRPLLLAGGIGLGPMLYLAARLAEESASGGFEAPVLALGFRSRNYIPSIGLPPGAVICTDDGSAGFAGTVVDWLWGFDPGAPPALYACGPTAMMAAADLYAAARGAPYQAATEQWMACGVGACAGCAVRLKDGSFRRACADGPVFDGRLLDWGA